MVCLLPETLLNTKGIQKYRLTNDFNCTCKGKAIFRIFAIILNNIAYYLLPNPTTMRMKPYFTIALLWLCATCATAQNCATFGAIGRSILIENNIHDAIHTISLANFAAGTYFVTIRSNEKTITEKVIKN